MNAEKKLKFELNELEKEAIKKLGDKATEEQKIIIMSQYDSTVDFIKTEAEKSPLFNAQVLQGHKTLNRLWKYLYDKAVIANTNGMAYFPDAVVFSWIKEYYALDDLEDILKEEEEKKKREEEAKKRKEEEKKKKTKRKTSSKKKTSKKDEKKSKEEEEKEKEEEKVDEHLKESVETPNLTIGEDGQTSLF